RWKAAQIAAEPAQPAHQIAALERERQDEQQIAFEGAAEHHDRPRALAAADVALPAGEPVERLERSQRGGPLERAPLPLDRRKLAVHRQHEAGARRAPDQAGRGSRRRLERPSAVARARDLFLRPREDAGTFTDGYARRDQSVGYGKVAPSQAGTVAMKAEQTVERTGGRRTDDGGRSGSPPRSVLRRPSSVV